MPSRHTRIPSSTNERRCRRAACQTSKNIQFLGCRVPRGSDHRSQNTDFPEPPEDQPNTRKEEAPAKQTGNNKAISNPILLASKLQNAKREQGLIESYIK